MRHMQINLFVSLFLFCCYMPYLINNTVKWHDELWDFWQLNSPVYGLYINVWLPMISRYVPMFINNSQSV
jgi:hypothetical protein